jgi:hypothetical protein
VRPDRGVGLDVRADLGDHAGRDLLGADTALAERAEQLGAVLGLDPHHQRVAGAGAVDVDDADLVALEAELVAHDPELAVADRLAAGARAGPGPGAGAPRRGCTARAARSGCPPSISTTKLPPPAG